MKREGWTERDWWSATSSAVMLDLIRLKARQRDRKLRLFACAVCRALLWPYLTDGRSRRAVEDSERYADGEIPLDELNATARAAKAAARALKQLPAAPDSERGAAGLVGMIPVKWGADAALIYAAAGQLARGGLDAPEEARARVERRMCDILRDLFGPTPFRVVAFAPAWLTGDVTALARGIYAEGAFSGLPTLADALADAGCDNQEVLQHCRSGSEHWRGCWVVDGLLGRS